MRLVIAALVFAVTGGAVTAQQPPAYRGCFNAEPSAGSARETAPRVEAARVIVGPGAVGTIGILVLRGRDMTEADTTATEPVGLVTESVAAALWPERDPIGNRMYDCIAGRWVTIVGVVANVMKNRTQPVHHVFVPAAQNPGRSPQGFSPAFQASITGSCASSWTISAMPGGSSAAPRPSHLSPF